MEKKKLIAAIANFWGRLRWGGSCGCARALLRFIYVGSGGGVLWLSSGGGIVVPCVPAELGLNPESQTVRPPRDSLITENSAPSPRKPDSPQQPINCTNTCRGIISHVVPLLRFCALGSGVDFAAGRENKGLV